MSRPDDKSPKVSIEALKSRSAEAPRARSGEERRSPFIIFGSEGYAPSKFFKNQT